MRGLRASAGDARAGEQVREADKTNGMWIHLMEDVTGRATPKDLSCLQKVPRSSPPAPRALDVASLGVHAPRPLSFASIPRRRTWNPEPKPRVSEGKQYTGAQSRSVDRLWRAHER